ncbi:DUF3592 domain-containing protein [Allohahella marinimesophila]|uniref:DUF3592 domain-containing protein n=1 Tax=Allohahella marinimesophila TaxID=1054972 RepID=A0ABP7NSC9_9GAMM
MQLYGPLLAGVVLLVIGIAVFASSQRKLKLRQRIERSWSTTTGQWIRIGKRVSLTSSPTSRDPDANAYLLDCEFTYTVEGKHYSSTTPLLYEPYLRHDIDTFLSKYKAGQSFTVLYDPYHPEKSVIETTLYGKSGKHQVFFSGLLMIIGIVLLISQAESVITMLSHQR